MISPAVSIITPTRNRRALLCETIESVQKQTVSQWEHVIVDDGSDDGTHDEVQARMRDDRRIRFIRRAGLNSGANVCRNIGIRECRAEHILFLDSDDVIAPECVERRFAAIERNKDIDFVVFRTGFFFNTVGDRDWFPALNFLNDDLTSFLYLDLPWTTAAPLWRKSALMRIGLFDESLLSWQDLELHVRAITAGLRYLRFCDVDNYMRSHSKDIRISDNLTKHPTHLEAAPKLFAKLEDLVRRGPGMNWVRQRALCSLYYFIAEQWLELGDAQAAYKTWRMVEHRFLGSPLLNSTGLTFLWLKKMGFPCERLINKWKGIMRLRSNPELVRP